jgi:hypothetical protein
MKTPVLYMLHIPEYYMESLFLQNNSTCGEDKKHVLRESELGGMICSTCGKDNKHVLIDSDIGGMICGTCGTDKKHVLRESEVEDCWEEHKG